MKRFCMSLVVLALASSAGAHADGVVFSDWNGGCRFGELADFSCRMRRDAWSAAGQQLGSLTFGQEEISHFLFVEIALRPLSEAAVFIVKIDDEMLPNGDIDCITDVSACSRTIVVNERLLRRLSTGAVLTVESQNADGAIKIEFPLRDFKRARAALF
jgi:hypothetical protein